MKKILTLASLFVFVTGKTECFAAVTVKMVPSDTATWISFMPVILFALVLSVTFIGLRKNKIKLSQMLAEKDKEAAKVTTTAGEPPPASVSRFIVFLSGLTALILSVCLSTFYMYQYFADPATPVNLSNLSTVIYGLGIGIIPYGFNKVASSIK